MTPEQMLEEARKSLRNKAYILANTDRDDPEKRASAIHEHEVAALAFAGVFIVNAHAEMKKKAP